LSRESGVPIATPFDAVHAFLFRFVAASQWQYGDTDFQTLTAEQAGSNTVKGTMKVLL
jgi:hypothetical protein